VGYRGAVRWDSDKPDGTYQTLLDVRRINELAWKAEAERADGARKTYASFLQHDDDYRRWPMPSKGGR
jgi:GDP-L-fucose synthase